MSFVVGWLALVLMASATVLSLVVWRRHGEPRVLLMSALYAALSIRFGLMAAAHGFDAPEYWMNPWLRLLIAAIAGGGVLGLEGLLSASKQREETLSRMLEALQETESALSDAVGWPFFRRAVNTLTEILAVDYAFVGELDEDGETVHLLALSENGRSASPFSYALAGTPCGRVVGREARAYDRGVRELFPDDELAAEMGVEAYLAVPLFGAGEQPLGLLGAMHRAPLENAAGRLPVLRIVAARAAAELQRERQDRALRDSEHRYRTLFEDSLDALFVTSMDGRMIDANPAAVELFGYDSREQILSEFEAERHYSESTDRRTVIDDLMRDGRFKDYPLEVKRRDGTVISVLSSSILERDDAGRPLHIRGSLRDVTRERELQRQLMSSQRMEAVGRMAGGVAHDFNNMLTVINGHSDLLLEEIDPASNAAADLRAIKSAVESAAAFTRRLLLLSRRKVLAPRPTDLNEVMSSLTMLLQKAVGEDVVMVLDLEPELGAVIADPSELEQVLLNLVINARDAMPGGGRLVIATRRVELDSASAAARGLDPGPWVELSVSDEGLGIEPEVRDHIFEPFFTTKDPSVGTGLGLSTVYGIVRQMGGDIRVESELGQGATFSILMPPSASAEEAGEAAVAAPKARGHETLLVVDDEPAVRNLLAQFLGRQGYQVLLAADGREALEQLAKRGRVDLLISDMTMPGLRGDRLAALARERQSDLRVLLISGNNKTGDAALEAGAPAAFLGKPFSTAQLAAEVRRLLDRPA